MPVREFFKGKNVLITGTTGFLGKVVLEKFLRVIPEVGSIYVLIRKKRGSPTMERFKKEVIGSPCFDVIRKFHTNFNDFINSKIVPIEGDLLKDGLDLSPENLKAIQENVHIIIHSAASVDFNARLDDAISINVKGTLRMFDLAKSCKILQNFLHVSTCCEQRPKKTGNLIEEKIYECDFDPEEKIKELEKLSVETLVREAPQLLGRYPNTYTFTKSICEKILEKRKGDTPLTILRPSIIGSSFKDPVPGWIDTISAAGALYFLGGLGILHEVQGDLNNIGDQIPVDMVADYIIVAAACYANKPKLTVIHSASSTKHPVKWKVAKDAIVPYFNANPPEKKISRASFTMIKSEKVLKATQVARRIPVFVFQNVAKALRSPDLQKKAGLLKMVSTRSESVAQSFKHFTTNEWFFSVDNTAEMQRFCSPEELEIFHLDVTKIEWFKYFLNFGWGLQKFVLKEQIEPPSHAKHMNLLERHRHLIGEVQWALNKGQNYYPRSNAEMKSLIISSNRVQETMKKLMKERKETNVSDGDFLKRLQNKADYLCEAMFATYSMPVIRVFAWAMNKILKSIYEKVVIDETSLAKFKNYDQATSGPLVLLPTHRSYMDFLLVSYIFFNYGLKCPHIAAAEDFLSVKFIHRILRASGAFFIRRKEVEFMELYRSILYEYIQRLLLDESWLEFFVEGTRSRAGKMLGPKFGLLNIVADTYFDQKLPDVQFVPITLNYEKVLEGESFPFELLGEAKIKESLLRVVRAGSILNQNFGRVYVEFGDPISLKAYTEKFGKKVMSTPQLTDGQIVESKAVKKFNPFEDQKDRKELINELALDIIDIMHKKLVVMPTAVVASVILMHRKGIKDDQLVSKVEWIAQELEKRGVKTATVNSKKPVMAVKMSLQHMEGLLKNNKDIFHPSVSVKADYKNVLMLSYYRNSLIFAFFNEALIACSLYAFGFDIAHKEGVLVDRVLEETLFLQKLIGHEIVLRNRLDKESFESLLNLMIQRGILERNHNLIKVKENSGEDYMSYFCSLLWPFIESYWVTFVFMFSLKTRKSPPTPDSFLHECQWFAETMYEERLLEHFESCSVDTIKNAFTVFKKWGVVKIESRQVEGKKAPEDHVELSWTEEKLLEFEGHIKKFMKYSYATSVRAPIERARKTILVDFPFMAKL